MQALARQHVRCVAKRPVGTALPTSRCQLAHARHTRPAVVLAAAPVDEATTEGGAQPAQGKSTGELAKEALKQTLTGEKTTAVDVLGEGTVNQLKSALGEERAGQFLGALDGLLANRRLATLVFAVVDVALIWVLIKVFKGVFSHE